MQRGFLPLPHYALQPLVRTIREVGELAQGLKGHAPASQPSQVSMHQPHAHRSLPDCRSDTLHRVQARITGHEHPWHTCLERERVAVKCPSCWAMPILEYIESRQDIPVFIPLHDPF